MELISGRIAVRRWELIQSCPAVVLAFIFFTKFINFIRRYRSEKHSTMLKDLSGEVKLGSGGGIILARKKMLITFELTFCAV